MALSERSWSDEERMVVLDDYLQSLEGRRKLDRAWSNEAASLLHRSNGSVNRKVANFKYVRTEVLHLPIAGLTGRALRDKELFESWHNRSSELHGLVNQIRSALGANLASPPTPSEPERKGFYDWLRTASPEDLEEEAFHRHERTHQLEKEGRTTVAAVQTRREGQSSFVEGALIGYVLCSGAGALDSCPGCGHDRTKLNGDPILEVHHVVPFSTTSAMDPRWGVPICANCHAVAHYGTLAARREMYENVLRVFPKLVYRLEELRASGLVRDSDLQELKALGLTPRD